MNGFRTARRSRAGGEIARKLRHLAKIVLFIVLGLARIAGLSIVFNSVLPNANRLRLTMQPTMHQEGQ
jgi:hypothetical protein